MKKIKKLTPDIIAKIAAGEVVERPSNVVKELLENSIDAEATSIIVTIENGGLDSVEVRDNGIGISLSEIPVAFELHTTSKLENEIEKVPTLGFRGEALASIAAVSRIKVSSRTPQEVTGVQLVIEGGNIITQDSVKINHGTIINVSGLFYNTPARRKFLKSATTERKRITDLIIQYALMYPGIHFALNESKSGNITTRIESPIRQDIMSVIYDVLGPEIGNNVIPVNSTIDYWNVCGFISNPHLNRSDRSLQYICVNGRPIKDNHLQTLVEEAYGSQMMRGAHPVVILQFSGPLDAIDFNVHPQKSEIRFQIDDPLFTSLPMVIQSALESSSSLPKLDQKKLERIHGQVKSQFDITQIAPPTNEIDQNEEIITNSFGDFFVDTEQTTLEMEPIRPSKSGFHVLGHIMNKFGIISQGDELWLVDIHAADERVKFELYQKGTERNLLSQQLLEPIILKLPILEKQLLLDNVDLLNKFGLKISGSVKNDIMIHSFPVYFDQDITLDRIEKLIKEIISSLNEPVSENIPLTPFSKIEYSIVARLSCHGSIRSGYKLSNSIIESVVENLLRCNSPWTCAHGRPTVLRISKRNLENWFNR